LNTIKEMQVQPGSGNDQLMRAGSTYDYIVAEFSALPMFY